MKFDCFRNTTNLVFLILPLSNAPYSTLTHKRHKARSWIVLRSSNAAQVSWEWLLLHLSNLFGGGGGVGGVYAKGWGGHMTPEEFPPPCLLCLTESRWLAERGRL